MKLVANIDNLVPNLNGYSYYYHSEYPLDIQVVQSDGEIKVVVRKFFKGKEIKTLTMGSATCGHMTDEQVEEYVLDVIEIFLN